MRRYLMLWVVPLVVVGVLAIGPLVVDMGTTSLRVWVLILALTTFGCWTLFATTYGKEQDAKGKHEQAEKGKRDAELRLDELLGDKAEQHLSRSQSIWGTSPEDVRTLAEAGAYKVEFDDPIHGRISIGTDAAMLLALPVVRRLASVAQLPFGTFTFPAANHSRLQHSLGVAHLCRTSLSSLLDGERAIYQRRPSRLRDLFDPRACEDALRIGEVAGLLHDLGHGPFAHATDRVVRAYQDLDAKKPDVYYGIQRIRQIPDEYLSSEDRARIERILTHSPDLTGLDKLIADLVSGDVDVDRLDYLQRDAMQSCMPQGRINSLGIAHFFRAYVEDTGQGTRKASLILDSRAAPLVGHFLYARHMMYMHCYDESMKALCERLLTKAVSTILSAKHGGTSASVAAQADFELFVERLMTMTDNELIEYLADVGGKHQLVRGIVRTLRFGPRFRRVDTVQLDEAGEELRKGLRQRTARPSAQRVPLDLLAAIEDNVAREVGIGDVSERWKIAIAPGAIELSARIELSMCERIDRTRYDNPKNIDAFLPILQKRPFKDALNEFLGHLGDAGEEARRQLTKLNPATMALMRDLEGSSFTEAMVSARNRLNVYAHMDILAEAPEMRKRIAASARKWIKNPSG
jgi:HD superfamily phosphohydrolase